MQGHIHARVLEYIYICAYIYIASHVQVHTCARGYVLYCICVARWNACKDK